MISSKYGSWTATAGEATCCGGEGALDRTRTCGLPLRRRSLYPPELPGRDVGSLARGGPAADGRCSPFPSAVADLVGEAADVAGRRGGAGRRQGRRRLGCCPGRGRGSGPGCRAGADVRPGSERRDATRGAEPGGAVVAGPGGAEVAAPAGTGRARRDVEQRRGVACRWWPTCSRGRPGRTRRRRAARPGWCRRTSNQPPACRRCRRSPTRATRRAPTRRRWCGSRRSPSRSARPASPPGSSSRSRLRTRPSRSSPGCWCPAPARCRPTAVTVGEAAGHAAP